MDYKKTATDILQLVGGKENVKSVIHCQSRLRISLYDYSKIDDAKVKAVSGVMGTKTSADVYQVVIGDKVSKVYDAFMKEVGTLSESSDSKEGTSSQKKPKINVIDMLAENMAAIITPVAMAMMGGGLALAIKITLTTIGVIQDGDSVSVILSAIGDAIFYFLPFFVALGTADRFKCNRMLALLIAAIMMYPTWSTLLAEGMESIVLFGFIPMKLVNYSSSMIPVIFAVYFMAKFEHFLKKHIHGMFGSLIIIFLQTIVTAILTLVLIGPAAQALANVVAGAITWLFSVASVPASAIFAGLYPIMVLTGTHTVFFPVVFDNFARYGADNVGALMSLAHTGMAAAALAIAITTKNKKLKGVASSGALVTGIGLAEPALYGVCVPFKKVLVSACAGAAAGGIVFGLFGVKVYAMGYAPLGTLLMSYIGPTFVPAMIGLLVAAAVSMILTFTFGYHRGDEEKVAAFSTNDDE